MEDTQNDASTLGTTMSGQELVDAVRNQVEYYFSKENLQSDVFLTSQMDAQMSVPISVVMKFAKMKALTQDESVVRQALENSTVTQIVDNRIKANIKPAGRSTIILREIPSDTSVDEVKEIFNYEGCKAISSIRSDIGDSWFVHMDSEEDAKDTLLDLRMKKRTFRGQSVKARLKTETVIRSFYPLQAAPVVPVGYPAMGFTAPMDMRVFGYALPEGVMPPVAMMAGTEMDAVSPIADNGKIADGEQLAVHGGNNNNKSAGGTKDNRNKQQSSNNRGNASGSNNNNNGKKGSENSSGNRSKGSNNTGNNSYTHAKTPVIEINSANFPPLHSEDTPVPTPGYKDSYLKYSFEEIIAIVKEVKDAALPATLTTANHPLALTVTPNLDLLKKQRTYSIDETREQLRQGRPVHREAITAGAVDYRSMMYGDENQQQQQPAAAGVAVAAAVPVTTAQPAVTTTPAPVAPKSATKARSNSQSSVGESQQHGQHGQTPKKISAASWAAMVKSSAAATAAAESTTTPAKAVVRAPASGSATKPAAATADAKKASSTSAVASGKGGDRKRTSSKSGENKEGGAKSAGAAGEGRGNGRDKKKTSGTNGKDSQQKKEEGGAAVEGESAGLAVSSVTTTSAAGEEQSSPSTGAAWGGKTSFAQIVKLKSTEDGPESPVPAPVSPVKTSSNEASSPKKPSTNSSGGRQSQGSGAKSAAAGSGSSNRNASGSRSAGSSGNKEGGGERRARNPEGGSAAGGGARKSSGERSSSGGFSSGAGSSGGANTSGVWVREALPALAKK